MTIPDDKTIMWFGKFKGITMANIPADYLLWMYDQKWCRGGIKLYIEENKRVLEMEMRAVKNKNNES